MINSEGQFKRTEEFIDKARSCLSSSTQANYLESHARDIARKMDAIIRVVDCQEMTLDAHRQIAAILEDSNP